MGERMADRLRRALDYRLHPDAEPITDSQLAVVLHALADHTALLAALDYRPPADGHWPQATSLGRWFHDTADQFDGPLAKDR